MGNDFTIVKKNHALKEFDRVVKYRGNVNTQLCENSSTNLDEIGHQRGDKDGIQFEVWIL